jgi:hypothetical protein
VQQAAVDWRTTIIRVLFPDGSHPKGTVTHKYEYDTCTVSTNATTDR